MSRSSELLLHIVPLSGPGSYRPGPEPYRPASLEAEGFVHLSMVAQVVETANRFFQGRNDLCLFVIDPVRLVAPLRFEDLYGHGAFPHLYGPLNPDALIKVVPFPCDVEGMFALPADLVEISHAR